MSAEVLRHLSRALPPGPLDKIGVAVSGGSDSLALLVMLNALAREHGFELYAATVDHRLRPEAMAEATAVADQCHRLNVPHKVLVWRGWDRTGNLQDAAREARYCLLAEWGQKLGLGAIALGHTQDDLAETFVMRLGRQAGVDGLSAMSDRFTRDGATFIRPLLAMTRAGLQRYLTDQGLSWASDPSNGDDKYDRARTRKALAILADLGLSAGNLAAVARNMTDARAALHIQMLDFARAHVSLHAGAVAIDGASLTAAPVETRRRVIAHALAWVGGSYYPPRGKALAQVLETLTRTNSATLHGCELRWRHGSLWIYREFSAVAPCRAVPGDRWDGRWRLHPITGEGLGTGTLHIAPLGPDGLKTCPGWRDLDLPRGVLLASPGVWQEDTCIAAPLAGRAENWQAQLERGEDEFFAAHKTH